MATATPTPLDLPEIVNHTLAAVFQQSEFTAFFDVINGLSQCRRTAD